ncbi:MAG TPA: TonB-dependent receptor, partial [Caulobacteraceae bacterium]|nr:TonB-dependent receptor [Caulobacteraceae bacterium]
YAAVQGRKAPTVQGELSSEAALALLTEGMGLSVSTGRSGMITLRAENDPQSGSAAGGGAEVEALIVTAQKREEDIQDVPIAISAFTQEDLDEQKIEGGFDLLKAIPNVTFSKNNFTSYNFSIRGIGTKAVSATTDPGVAVAFNNSGLIVNRLFEQEYFDVERVEVLRGPQGTLYGRNATSGVINVISAKPDFDEFKGWIKGEVGNYEAKRLSAMINVPLAEDRLAIRFAGALTSREGYGYNEITNDDVDGRNLWSARVTLGFQPTEALRGELIWERFEEDDDRARTSKQLCHTDLGPGSVLDVENIQPLARALMSQGCSPGSLYDPGAFRAPNGDSLPFIFVLKGFLSPIIDDTADPYNGIEQSDDLRVISSRFDPIYRAKADVLELNLEYDVTDSLTLFSQTLYNKDEVYSTQDFNRFNTRPVLSTAPNACQFPTGWELAEGPNACPGGFFTDPQLGTSNAFVLQDISSGTAKQFSQEFRLQSAFDGPVNFSLGANYVRFETDIDYYVLGNVITIAGLHIAGGTLGGTDPQRINIDPNPIESINGMGQNYFRSKNPYELESKSVFGEFYWNFSEQIKLTAGLRYTNDEKAFELWPTVLLNSARFPLRHQGDIEQSWGELTGRLGMDWKPELPFTDQTMLYAFYSRGYKAGGANPPNMDPPSYLGGQWPVAPNSGHPATFDPEFVDAFEIGSKNVLLGGGLIFNATAFYYDYKDYQVSQIVDRLALNENFDATVWGLEFETVWSPTRDLRINANLGYLDTKVADGESSIDPMNRAYGHHDDWVVMKNWVQYPSNCIVPKEFVAKVIDWARDMGPENLFVLDPMYVDRTMFIALFNSPCTGLYSPTRDNPIYGNAYSMGTGIEYDPFLPQYAEANFGKGFNTPLGGNELPNAPHWTVNVGAQYGFDVMEGWRGTLRGDAYWQSQSWHRIYNLGTYDKLHGWYNANLSLWLENDDGLKIELYAKNVLDADPITDAFLNSDDSGLTTNVFVLDPRLIGLSIRKEF